MKKYRIEELLVGVSSIEEAAQSIFRELDINPLLISSSVTREEFDSSDFTAWSLFYGVDKAKEMKEDTEKLLKLKVKDKSIFSIVGNGFGTGLSVTSNLASKYD